MATRILVVNDTLEILEMFRTLLEEEGYEVILSSYPLQKVNEIENIKPDLIILDLIFREERLGWQMLQLLKMQRSTSSIPVVVCTASEQLVREMEGFLVSKHVLVVYKPFDIDDLLHIIKQSLQGKIKEDGN
jgi:DNA-binding response OmpR family regulator